MQRQQTGIVLKHYVPKRNMLVLLDETMGRINVVANCDALSAGTLLEYRIVQKRNRLMIEHLELLSMPLVLARHNLLFVHHLLEVCYHFILEGSRAPSVYHLLRYVLNRSEFNRMQQKNILCMLYTLLGIYPEQIPFFTAYASALEQEPLSAIIDKKINRKIEKYIAKWLYQCIQMHAQATNFKTIHFLDEIQ